MELKPIRETMLENLLFMNNPDCKESLAPCIGFYKKVGFNPPWLCYYVTDGEQLVASAGFKGQPINYRVEIAYATFERYRRKGIGTEACKMLVTLALKTDPKIIITARTLPEQNFSTRILEKNSFNMIGTVMDAEDGEVWEWQYNGI